MRPTMPAAVANLAPAIRVGSIVSMQEVWRARVSVAGSSRAYDQVEVPVARVGARGERREDQLLLKPYACAGWDGAGCSVVSFRPCMCLTGSGERRQLVVAVDLARVRHRSGSIWRSGPSDTVRRRQDQHSA